MPTQVMLRDTEVLRRSKVHSQQSRAEGWERCRGFKMHEMQKGARWGGGVVVVGGGGMCSFISKSSQWVMSLLNREEILVMNSQFLQDCRA